MRWGEVISGSFLLIVGAGMIIGMFWIPIPHLVVIGLLCLVAGGFTLTDGLRGKWTYYDGKEGRFK